MPSLSWLAERYRTVRLQTDALREPLTSEDMVVQSMSDASPTKWHLAHTSWFFETFVLAPTSKSYNRFDAAYHYLFNSYYNTVGAMHPRPKRGLLSRPGLEDVCRYRRHIDEAVLELLSRSEDAWPAALRETLLLGIHHEQQHQELILTDIKHMLSCNPTEPPYRERPRDAPPHDCQARWLAHEGGVYWIGMGEGGFAFDNERPRHQVIVGPFRIAAHLVTNAEFAEFIADGGYERPELWLSDGWIKVQSERWSMPMYWRRENTSITSFTLAGRRPAADDEPVCHVSFYEADAYARWAGARLPTEAEWEVAVAGTEMAGNFLEGGRLHPAPCTDDGTRIQQAFGDVWEWTASPYVAYPGYRAPEGALGEYNGKFMCNQQVLRGGSCATPHSHIRATYRNFFPADARWQFSGFRVAADAE